MEMEGWYQPHLNQVLGDWEVSLGVPLNLKIQYQKTVYVTVRLPVDTKRRMYLEEPLVNGVSTLQYRALTGIE